MTRRALHALIVPVAASFLFALPAFGEEKSSPLHQAMSKSMKEMHSMKMTGDVDRDFAMMMKHHHQSGIDMARVQLREGKDPELKKQAQKIVDAQTKEIAELDRWMQSKGGAQAGSSAGSGDARSGHAGHK